MPVGHGQRQYHTDICSLSCTLQTLAVAQVPPAGRPVSQSLGSEVFASHDSALHVEGRHASVPIMAPGKQSSRLRRMLQHLHRTSSSSKHSNAADDDSADGGRPKQHGRLPRRRWRRRQTKSASPADTALEVCSARVPAKRLAAHTCVTTQRVGVQRACVVSMRFACRCSSKRHIKCWLARKVLSCRHKQ